MSTWRPTASAANIFVAPISLIASSPESRSRALRYSMLRAAYVSMRMSA